MHRTQTALKLTLLLALISSFALFAGDGLVTTVAGNGTSGSGGLGGPATSAQLNSPFGLCFDPTGNLFIADYSNFRVVRVDAVTGILTLVAGTGTNASTGDGGPASLASVSAPAGLAMDAAGNLYISEMGGNRVRKVDAQTGIITTFAGNGSPVWSGDGGPATAAGVHAPVGLAFDAAGNLYLAEYQQSVRRVDAVTGVITTLLPSGPGVPLSPAWLAIDHSGNLLIADLLSSKILRLNLTTGAVDTFAGDGGAAFDGDGIPATGSSIGTNPVGIAVDPAGNVYLAGASQYRIRRIDAATGVIATVAGNGFQANVAGGGFPANTSPDGFPANVTPISPVVAVIAPDGSLVFSVGGKVRRVSLPSPWTSTATSTTVAPASPNPGQTLTFTATPAAIGGGGTPTGTVTFMDPTYQQVIGTAALSAGIATFTTPAPSSPGTYHLVASYAGDSAFAASVSPVGTIIVQAAPVATTLILTSSPNPSLAAAAVNFQATISFQGTPGYTPSGFVQVMDGSAAIATAQVYGPVVSLSASLAAGTHALTAVYSGDSHFLTSTSPVLNQVVNPASTTVTIASSPNPATLGGPLTLTATVSPSAATGVVGFNEYGQDTVTSWGSATLVNGTATVTIPSLPNSVGAGTHSIQADYRGDTNYKSSSSASLSQQVLKQAATVSLYSANNPLIIGIQYTITATVAAAAGATSQPTGSVQLFDGATSLGTANLASGTAQFQATFSTTGAHSLTAVYSGDAGFAGATSPPYSEVVKKLAPFSLTIAPNPTIDPAATGTITFGDGGPPPTVTLGVATLVNGAASFTTSNLSAGTHALSATYSGDDNFVSSGTSIAQVVKVASTTALTATPAAPVYGQAVQLTASVAPATATGTVQFLDGATALGTVTVSGGAAVLSVPSFSAGTHSLTATYSGDATYGGSTSAAVAVTVIKATSTIAISSSLNPSPAGQAITFTIALTPANATGTVQLLDGATVLASLSASTKTASITLAVGPHTVTAVYSGDPNFAGATSTPVNQLVTTTTTTSVTATPPSSSYGQPVQLTAAVTPVPAGGTVQFLDGSTVLGSAAVQSGSASLSIATFAVGAHAITAVYGGNGAGFLGSTSAVFTETVGKDATTATLAASPNPAAAGTAVTLSAAVSPATATGTVQFLDGATVLGAATLNNGTASLTTSALAVGSHALKAAYSGDATDASATSAVLTLSVVKSATTAALTSSLNPSVSGHVVTFTAQVSPAAATGSIQFKDGSSLLGTVTVSGGSAALAISTLSVGTHSITAIYSGDANHTGSTSPVLTQTVTAPPPGAPSNLTATAASASQISLSWTASTTSGVTYNVYSSTTSGFTPSAGNRVATGVTTTSHAHTGLSPSTVHYYVVTAQNSAGESVASNQAGATTKSGVSCHVGYTVTSQWNVGFGTAITIKNTGSQPINGWNLTWTWAGNQQITQAWNSNYTQNGKNASLTNASWNPTIAAGATLSGMGFNGSYSGTNTAPTAFYVNGTLCQ